MDYLQMTDEQICAVFTVAKVIVEGAKFENDDLPPCTWFTAYT